MSYEKFKIKPFRSATKLWEALSPTKNLFESPCNIIFRGQANSRWKLIPTVLREGNTNPASVMWGNGVKADEQIFTEVRLLELFAEYCDQAGIRIPGDSPSFRNEVLSPQCQDFYFKQPEKWPNPALFEVMAMAQHHGIPTRLLDWTKQPYVAAYFAASSALSNAEKWKRGDKLAVWALDIEQRNLYQRVRIVTVPGAVTPHLSAQSGLFTVHPHNGKRGDTFEVVGLEEEFCRIANTPLLCMTLPVKESLTLYELCNKSGINAATIYRSMDGAGKAVLDNLNAYEVNRRQNL